MSRTWVLRAAGLAAATLLIAEPAGAQTPIQVDWCVNKGEVAGPDLQLDSCNAVIRSGKYQGKGAAWTFYSRANAHRNLGETDRAIADFTEAIRLDPSYSFAYGNRGLAYRAKGDTDRALADISKAIEIGSAEVNRDYINRGLVYRDKGDNDRAIADFNESIRLDPKFALAFNNRGIAYRLKGDTDRAVADYNEAIRLNPQYAEAFYNRGIAYRAKGDNDRAIADYSEAIRLDPKYVLAFNNRGNVHLGKQDYDHAIADYSEAIRLAPKLVIAVANRANAYDIKGDTRAIADHDAAVRLEPENIERYKSRGYSNVYAGNYGAAASDLGRAVQQNPNDPYPLLWLYIARARLDHQSAAVELEIGAARLKPAEWPFAAVELFVGRRTPEAVLAAAGSPDERCEAQFYIGVWHLLRSDRIAAVAPLKAAAETCPTGFMEYRGAQAELKRLGAR